MEWNHKLNNQDKMTMQKEEDSGNDDSQWKHMTWKHLNCWPRRGNHAGTWFQDGETLSAMHKRILCKPQRLSDSII